MEIRTTYKFFIPSKPIGYVASCSYVRFYQLQWQKVFYELSRFTKMFFPCHHLYPRCPFPQQENSHRLPCTADCLFQCSSSSTSEEHLRVVIPRIMSSIIVFRWFRSRINWRHNHEIAVSRLQRYVHDRALGLSRSPPAQRPWWYARGSFAGQTSWMVFKQFRVRLVCVHNHNSPFHPAGEWICSNLPPNVFYIFYSVKNLFRTIQGRPEEYAARTLYTLNVPISGVDTGTFSMTVADNECVPSKPSLISFAKISSTTLYHRKYSSSCGFEQLHSIDRHSWFKHSPMVLNMWIKFFRFE